MRMTSRSVLKLVAILLVFITGSGQLIAQGSQSISYLTGREEATLFNLLNLDTGEIRQIDLGIEPIYGYDWSPDGQKIAFDNGHDIYAIHADGTNLQPLTHSTETVHYAAPAWSPDGSQIALIEWTDAEARLALMRSDGSDFQRLMGQADMVRGQLVWSPDGRFIAVNSVATLVDDLLVVDVAACLQTPDQCLDSSVTLTGSVSDWSPDGRRALLSGGKFSSSLYSDEIALKLADPQCHQQPHIPCAAGISLGVNTHWPANAANTVYPYDSDGHWSADGSRIAFVSNRSGAGQIYVIDRDGSHLRQMSREADAYSPRWRPA